MKPKPLPPIVFPKRKLSLTRRERQVLKAYAEGHSYEVIGEKLDISTMTVNAFLQKIREKLRAKNRSDLIAFAIKENLLSPKQR